MIKNQGDHLIGYCSSSGDRLQQCGQDYNSKIAEKYLNIASSWGVINSTVDGLNVEEDGHVI